jgi:hypothetical protein
MLDVVADTATNDIRKSAAADSSVVATHRAGLKYLEASGARAISVTIGCGHTVINVGYLRDAVETFWTPADKARTVAARARSIAGGGPDVAVTIAALREAAAQLRVTLTEHDTAISRAASAAERLDAFMASMTGTGVLREFNRTFKTRRQAAFARGEQFMRYPIALARLRLALVPLLQNGGKPVVGASLFAEIFGH